MPLKKGSPGCACCSNDCLLMPVDPAAPDAAFADLAAVQAAFSLRAGAWTDVSAAAGQLDLAAAGVQLLADAEPNYSPFGVTFTTYFKGRDGSVIRFFVGADADVSLSAEVTLGADCGELRFYEEALTGEARIGDVHIIRELRAEEWHKITVCYDPTRGYLTATITTLAGETWAYSVAVTSTGQAGYGLGTETDTAEFKTFAATATEHYLARDPADSCGDVAIATTQQGQADTPRVMHKSIPMASPWDLVVTISPPGTPYTLHCTSATSASDLETMLRAIPGLESTTVTKIASPGSFTISFNHANPPITGITADAYVGGVLDSAGLEIDPGTPPLNDTQTATILSNPQAGTWTLALDAETTTDLAWDCDATAVQAALESLSNIGSGNVTVTGTNPAFQIEFVGTLAAADISTLVAAHNFQACDCPYDSYTYEYGGDCLKHCPTCDPSCALAGSPFSAIRSACDWDGAGYVFGDGIATGTGTLTHRTEIWTVPYVLSATFDRSAAGTYTISADAVDVVIVVTAGTPNTATISVAGSSPVALTDTAETITICRQATSVTVEIGEWRAKADVAAPSYPLAISFTTDAADVVVDSLLATRHGLFWAACPHCHIKDLCGCSQLYPPSETMSADFTSATLTDGQCSFCDQIAQVWGLFYAGNCTWIGGVSPACTYTQRFYNGGVIAPEFDTLGVASFVVTATLTNGTVSGLKWEISAQLISYIYSRGMQIITHIKWASYESEDFTASECATLLPRVLSLSGEGESMIPWTPPLILVPFWELFCGGAWPASVTLA